MEHNNRISEPPLPAGHAGMISPGIVDENQMRESVKSKGVYLFGGGADEAPDCYKKLDEVLNHHQNSIQVEARLTPIIVCMAGSEVRDPYKD